MIVTKKHSIKQHGVLTSKKKHRAVSITQTQYAEFTNMNNILNTVQRDQGQIAGYNLDKYLIPTKLSDFIIPVEISYSGDKFGEDIISDSYSAYNPVEAGYLKKDEFESSMAEFGVNIDADNTLADELRKGEPDFKVIDGFRLWLNPEEYQELGSYILSNFKASTSEDQFTSIDSLKDFGSFTDYGERLTTTDKGIRRQSDYVAIKAKANLYKKRQYVDDIDELMYEWFKAACDNIVSNKIQG